MILYTKRLQGRKKGCATNSFSLSPAYCDTPFFVFLMPLHKTDEGNPNYLL